MFIFGNAPLERSLRQNLTCLEALVWLTSVLPVKGDNRLHDQWLIRSFPTKYATYNSYYFRTPKKELFTSVKFSINVYPETMQFKIMCDEPKVASRHWFEKARNDVLDIFEPAFKPFNITPK